MTEKSCLQTDRTTAKFEMASSAKFHVETGGGGGGGFT